MDETDADDRATRIIIPMLSTLLEAIDDWRYANRVPTRAEAVRRLIARGLADGGAERTK